MDLLNSSGPLCDAARVESPACRAGEPRWPKIRAQREKLV